MPSLHERIVAIPDDGWWKGDTMSSFLTTSLRLRTLGLDDDTIVDVLENIYYVMSDEFGG